MHREPPVIVIGAGIAGLATALKLAPMPVVLLTGGPLGHCAATAWAQGGIAAAMGGDDVPELHLADTLAAGCGLVDEAVAGAVTREAPACIEDLLAAGVPFDRDSNGALALGLEGAHSRRRVAHVGGDGSGAAILNALLDAVRATPSITIHENVYATRLVTEGGRVRGVLVNDTVLPARAVVLASGGLGGLYADTTNPLSAVGSGLALAARAGAAIQDAEFVQFHPTAMALGRDPMPLATEALRGEGAALIGESGEPLMAGVSGGDLAPRDVVSRHIHARLAAGEAVYLDGRAAIGTDFPKRFPAVTAACRAAGLDPATTPIPVRPAAHYHMGGVAVDGSGRTSLPGLWACGEVACTGLHGANRLASNSLLEGLAFARWIAADIAAAAAVFRPLPDRYVSAPTAPGGPAPQWLRDLMARDVGVVRRRKGLDASIARLATLAFDPAEPHADPALAALFVAVAARERHESRGGHLRSDFPETAQPAPARQSVTLDDLRRMAAPESALALAVGA